VKLSRLLDMAAVDILDGALTEDPDIRSVHYRSQSVRPGGLFVAICGHAVDGHGFIPDAEVRGSG
jgi:UDP-N-acetylmuramyl tripeptide synthase